MEPARQRVVIPVSYGWSDVGSWKALADISASDEEQNYFRRAGFALDAHDNYVYSKKTVALIGVEGLCLVETDDAILVTSKDRSEEVKRSLNNCGKRTRTSQNKCLDHLDDLEPIRFSPRSIPTLESPPPLALSSCVTAGSGSKPIPAMNCVAAGSASWIPGPGPVSRRHPVGGRQWTSLLVGKIWTSLPTTPSS